MLILLSNDDGVEAPGLEALEAALAPLGEVWVVAPATEQSAKSHSFTMAEPVRIRQHGPRRFSCTGTPADAVFLAVHHILPERPALVVSGINRGSNLSTDVVYSGTVAAAREGALMGIPALAASLHLADPPRLHWETAQAVVRQVVEAMLADPVAAHPHTPVEGVLLSLNVPDVPRAALKGLLPAPLGRRHYVPQVVVQQDPRGKPYFWLGGPHERFSDVPGTDGPLCEDGWAVLTPLSLDLTDHHGLAVLRRWVEEKKLVP